jgi:hypothetical protein
MVAAVEGNLDQLRVADRAVKGYQAEDCKTNRVCERLGPIGAVMDGLLGALLIALPSTDNGRVALIDVGEEPVGWGDPHVGEDECVRLDDDDVGGEGTVVGLGEVAQDGDG